MHFHPVYVHHTLQIFAYSRDPVPDPNLSSMQSVTPFSGWLYNQPYTKLTTWIESESFRWGALYFCVSFALKNQILTSAGHLCWIYRQLIGMSYIALARQVQIYRNISDPIGRLGSWSFWYIVLQLAKHYTPLQCIVIHCTAEKKQKLLTYELIYGVIFYFLLHPFSSNFSALL